MKKTILLIGDSNLCSGPLKDYSHILQEIQEAQILYEIKAIKWLDKLAMTIDWLNAKF